MLLTHVGGEFQNQHNGVLTASHLKQVSIDHQNNSTLQRACDTLYRTPRGPH